MARYRLEPYRWMDLYETARAALLIIQDFAEHPKLSKGDKADLIGVADELSVALKENNRQLGNQLVMPGMERWISMRPWITETVAREKRAMLTEAEDRAAAAVRQRRIELGMTDD